ncbi:YhcH/YjgK/YiaL family protein [Streptococcus cuniculi]|uniref:YhcH/YjgK/YiaL family protein n=1 Tax=Streptococcus cuniculi TaxID=1432788 RepID=A0A4Y9JBE3_9STRE|nr:YhcH/YjgK/YiaL family protein [Streptococcus cuniculi]MBF0778777.1 YhcH/YjgK/YiaL family protein [Streptococcus cuniculi]TFU97279.1 YhcH/YjgK/YiaL family protein [Streptococcus cuniculi]
MIITKVEDFRRYAAVNPHFQSLVNFLENTNLRECPEGKVDVKGEQVFGNCFTYIADGEAGDFFETHRNYIDVHLVVENEEAMAVTSGKSAKITEAYDAEKDIEFYQGQVEQLIHLHAGECLVTFPEDLHQPKVRLNDLLVKKIVFKVAIN